MAQEPVVAVKLALLVLAPLLVAGCDKNCQNTCTRLFDGGECNIQYGETADKARRDCISSCELALRTAGEMGTYNPYNRQNPQEPAKIENERQAAEWMECVWSVECPELDPATGICAPVIF